MLAPLPLTLVVAISALVGAGATAILIPLLRRRLLDFPNDRSSHSSPIPRGGGLGVVAGTVAGLLVGAHFGLSVGPAWYWGCVFAVAATGFIDDLLGGVSPGGRLLLQLGVAGVVLLIAGPVARAPLPPPLDLRIGVFGYLLALVWIVGVINLYNFLDGIDGYAAAQGSVAGVGMMLVFGGTAGMIGAAMSGACMGFLLFNWHPAKVFLGDIGSGFIGAVFALSPFLEGQTTRPAAVFVVALFLWFFLADGAFTIVRRLLNRERLWEAHRSHLYQRLVRTGWSHGRVVLFLLVGMIPLTAFVSLVGVCDSHGSLPPGAWAAAAVAMAMMAGVLCVVLTREQRRIR